MNLIFQIECMTNLSATTGFDGEGKIVCYTRDWLS